MVYFEAYTAESREILGTCDGQYVFHGRDYRRTKHYKRLVSGKDRPKFPRVCYWLVVTQQGRWLEKIFNDWYEGVKG